MISNANHMYKVCMKIFPKNFMSDVAWKLDGETQMNPGLLKLLQLMKI